MNSNCILLWGLSSTGITSKTSHQLPPTGCLTYDHHNCNINWVHCMSFSSGSMPASLTLFLSPLPDLPFYYLTTPPPAWPIHTVHYTSTTSALFKAVMLQLDIGFDVSNLTTYQRQIMAIKAVAMAGFLKASLYHLQHHLSIPQQIYFWRWRSFK